jgi:hypothetical protein
MTHRRDEKPKALGSFPVEIQETFLIEDLLFAMTSIEGVYVKRKKVGHGPDPNYEYAIEPYLS